MVARSLLKRIEKLTPNGVGSKKENNLKFLIMILLPLSAVASGYYHQDEPDKTTPVVNEYYTEEVYNEYSETTVVQESNDAHCAATAALASLPTGSHKGAHGHTTLTSAFGRCSAHTGIALGLQKHNGPWVFKINLSKSAGEAIGGGGLSYTFK